MTKSYTVVHQYILCLFILCLMLGATADGLSQSYQKKSKKIFHKCKRKNKAGIIVEADTKDKKKSNIIGQISWKELKQYPPHLEYSYYLDSASLDNKLTDALRNNPNKCDLLVFGGIWWCPDTRDILGKLLLHLERANFNSDDISFVGINRKKTGAKKLESILNVSRVPTILVFKDGKELGRIVEYGTIDDWETELVQLLTHYDITN